MANNIGGIYTDPFHSDTSNNSSNIFQVTAPWFGGIRVCATTATKKLLVLGSDDGHHFWTLEGKFANDDTAVAMDFTPKAPGVGLLQCLYPTGKIEFLDADGTTVSNTWSRLTATESFKLQDQTKHDAFNNVNGFYVDRAIFTPGSFAGIRVVSDRLGKSLRDEVCVVGTDNGIGDFWAHESGSFDKAANILKFNDSSGKCHNGTIQFSNGTEWTKVTLGTFDMHLLPKEV
jgi:hypothetical protein